MLSLPARRGDAGRRERAASGLSRSCDERWGPAQDGELLAQEEVLGDEVLGDEVSVAAQQRAEHTDEEDQVLEASRGNIDW